MFSGVWVTSEEDQIDMRELERECDISIDFSETTRLQRAFYTNLFHTLGVIDVRNVTTASGMQYCFYAYAHTEGHGYPPLRKIEKIISSEETTWTTTAFNAMGGLVEVYFEGVIAKTITFRDCYKLNKASITSVINALSTTTSGLTVTFSKSAVNNAFATAEGAADGSTSAEWTALKNTRTNWNIALA
jgi:hypothetical protein